MIKRKLFKSISIILVLSFVLSTFISNSVVAVGETKIKIQDCEDGYITLSNVVEQKTFVDGYYKLYVVNAPVTITFNGKNLCRETIQYSKDGKLKDGNYSGEFEDVKFSVRKYTNYGGKEVFDELVTLSNDIPYYISGNYTKLTKAGYYFANASTEAAEGSTIIIQVVASNVAVAKSITKLDFVSGIVKLSGVEKEIIKNKTKYSGFCKFKDVPISSKHLVGYAYNKGWVTAKSKTEFGVKDAVTEYIAARAVLKATNKTVNASNIKTVIGKSSVVTKAKLAQMFATAQKLKK